ncbi:MAG: hypothetical protein V1884_01050 [Candidatus Omnitrophota bacterium]
MTRPKKGKIIALFISIFIFFPVRQTQSLETVAEPKKIEYSAGDLKDPFQEEHIGVVVEEQVLEAGPLPSVTIQGIVWGGTLAQAIINDKVVKVGDTIEGMQLLEINREGIIVLYAGTRRNLSAPSVIQMGSINKKSEGGTDEDEY